MPDSTPGGPEGTRALERANRWARRSVLLKVLAIALLVLILLVPLGLLDGLIAERQRLRDRAETEVAAKWGGPQTVGGPVLSVPFRETVREADGAARTYKRWAHFLPERLDVAGALAPEVRRRGIYEAVLYRAELDVSGSFARPDLGALGLAPAQMLWDEAIVEVGIPDLLGVREPIRIAWGDTAATAEPGLPTTDVFASGVTVPVTATPDAERYAFRYRLDLNGSRWLGTLPFGRETTLALRAPWPDPQFDGAFLPAERAVTADGFEARWRVLHLNRNYPQQFTGAFGGATDAAPQRGPYPMAPYEVARAQGGRDAAAFGVALRLPVDAYQKTDRAAKYALVVVLLTFTVFFFVEVLGGRRVHPIQYLLVGLALCLFYLLLLALSEHVAFDAAYLVALAAVLGLVAFYVLGVLKSGRLAGVVVGLLALFFGFFWVLLQLQDWALLLGSVGLLVILGAVMALSRHIDWYALGEGGPGGDGPGDGPTPAARTAPARSPS